MSHSGQIDKKMFHFKNCQKSLSILGNFFPNTYNCQGVKNANQIVKSGHTGSNLLWSGGSGDRKFESSSPDKNFCCKLELFKKTNIKCDDPSSNPAGVNSLKSCLERTKINEKEAVYET